MKIEIVNGLFLYSFKYHFVIRIENLLWYTSLYLLCTRLTVICLWSNKTDVHVITNTFVSRGKVRTCCLTLPCHSVWNLPLLGTSLMVLYLDISLTHLHIVHSIVSIESHKLVHTCIKSTSSNGI